MVMLISRVLENSTNAENALKSLVEEGELMNTIPKMNLLVLKERFKCSDVFPVVEIDLVRSQDRDSPRRVELAVQVATAMTRSSMFETFTGKERESKLLLAIKITVVSDGCQRNEKMTDLMGKVMGTKGKGLAKVTISYCLVSRETGEVAVAKQISRAGRGSCSSKTPVLELAAEMQDKISEEVKFVCCCRLGEWMELSKRLLAVDDMDPTLEETDST
jgi:hypothetical protein